MRKISQIQEKRIANKIGGREVSNSGATKFDKGDVSNLEWLIEAKTKATSAQSMTVQREWMEKIKAEALSQRKPYHAVAISFDNKKDYFILEDEFFYRLVGMLEQDENG